VRLVNVDGETRIRGSELLLRYRWRAFTVTGSYVFVDATEPDEEGQRTPARPTDAAPHGGNGRDVGTAWEGPGGR
jgi:iron complex outermembrane receptor protein